MEFRCVECGYRIGGGGKKKKTKPLFIQYSPGNIRLTKCENCKSVADNYIECELMILWVDLLLHKQRAYRHVLFNLLNPQVVNLEGLFWKTTIAFILLDGYRIMVANLGQEGWGLRLNISSLLFTCVKMLTDLLVGNFMFLYSLIFMTRYFLDITTRGHRYKEILLAVFISSYSKLFLLTMPVWRFPPSVLFAVDVFVLSSNTVALNVITESSMYKSIGVCLSAHAIKLLIKWLLNMIIISSSLDNQELSLNRLVPRLWASLGSYRPHE